ncbi:MAG: DNA cytosine methyltransferase [Sulfitobacter sp.]|nr:DNA cytosine methyltransferase [Sulfitobacter sp.]
MGYSRAGFEVVGVDIEPQPDYPFEFIQGDALQGFPSLPFDAVHASPPCQAFTAYRRKGHGVGDAAVDLVPDTRALLEDWGGPFVIENVPGAPVRADLTLCGSMFGLDVRRHRVFELGGWPAPLQPSCAHGLQRGDFPPATNRKNRRRTAEIGVWRIPLEDQQRAMGVDWLPLKALSQAIPPAYTEWIGTRLLWHRGHSAADPGV